MSMLFFDDRTKEDFKEASDEDVLYYSIDEPRLFEILVDRYQDAFVRKVRKVLGNREEVHDVVQETFTKIYMHASKFEKQEGASFSSWAYRILMNTSFTYYQKIKKESGATARLDDEIWGLISDEKTESTLYEERGLQDMVASVISRMPEPLARVLTLYFIEDKAQKEIAEEEGISVSAVKTRMHRAKKEFKKNVCDLSI